MIGVDTNVLVHAHRRDSKWHAAARKAISRLAEGTATWMIPWPCLHEFLGIVTHPRVFSPPSTIDEATQQIELWMESPSLQVLGESPRHWQTLCRLIKDGRIVGPKVHDARIACICLDHQVEALWSADRDFLRFPALKTVNPLIAG